MSGRPALSSQTVASVWKVDWGNIMIWFANILVALVAALHVYFLILEMFLWTRPLGLKTFGNSPEKAAQSAVLAANQGLYNGFLAAGLAWGLLQGNAGFAFQIKVFFLLCVIVAGVYGAASVSRRILFVQAAPAALALILLWLA
jgi:putative membrane protein